MVSARATAHVKKKEEDRVLPDFKQSDSLTLKKLDPSQHFTKPTARYSKRHWLKS